MRSRQNAQHGVFTSERLAELQKTFNLVWKEMGVKAPDSELVKERIAGIILSLESRHPDLETEELKPAVLQLYLAMTKNISVPKAEDAPMSDDKRKKGPQDRAKINLSEDYEIKYWTKKFGVSEVALAAAVERAGNSAKAVEEFLKKR